MGHLQLSAYCGRKQEQSIERLGQGDTGLKQSFILAHDLARSRAIQAVKDAPEGYVVEVKEKTRSIQQNALLWALLMDVSQQVEWYGKKLPSASWKDIFTAALRKNEVVPNLDGTGFVILGQRTSTMTKAEFSELCELILAFGAERGVEFSDPESFGMVA